MNINKILIPFIAIVALFFLAKFTYHQIPRYEIQENIVVYGFSKPFWSNFCEVITIPNTRCGLESNELNSGLSIFPAELLPSNAPIADLPVILEKIGWADNYWEECMVKVCYTKEKVRTN